MSDVLVLFYDKKDKARSFGTSTLEDEIKRGFEGTEVNYDIQVASPSHTSYIAKGWMNKKKYDGIIVVAGLSCSLSVPSNLMEELYNNDMIHIASPDWPNLKQSEKSKYYGQQRHVPILGIPTRHKQDPDGSLAFSSMIMESAPAYAMCVGVEQGYQAARLMLKFVNNKFKNVKFLVPDISGLPSEIAGGIRDALNLEFKVWEQGNIGHGPEKISYYEWRLETVEGKTKGDDDILHVGIYEDFNQIKKIDSLSDFIIGAYAPDKVNLPRLIRLARMSAQLQNVIHVRPGISENAAMAVASCLYNSKNDKGEPRLKEEGYFREKRRNKSKENVEEFKNDQKI